jgi:hypothetical protein
LYTECPAAADIDGIFSPVTGQISAVDEWTAFVEAKVGESVSIKARETIVITYFIGLLVPKAEIGNSGIIWRRTQGRQTAVHFTRNEDVIPYGADLFDD